MTAAPTKGLRAVGVRYSRGGTPIIAGADLSVAPGRLTALIGPNGAGKSTLLQLLTGALRPDAGTVSLDGEALGGIDAAALARRRAVLQQALDLNFPFRAIDVVLLGRSPHAGEGNSTQDRANAAAALNQVEAGHLAGRLFPTLSGGERQRVHLARVLAQVWPEDEGRLSSPRYLLLDEPTNNLDLSHQHQLMTFGVELAARGFGVLAVVHDPNLAAQYAQRIVVIAGGRVLADGPPDAILTPATIREAFSISVVVRRHPSRDRPVVITL